MKCPHCLVAYHSRPEELFIGADRSHYGTGTTLNGADTGWVLLHEVCPECKKIILRISAGDLTPKTETGAPGGIASPRYSVLAYPRSALRPCPAEVPLSLAEDYREACLVLSDSPKASAALSRRCLQNLLRQAVKLKPGKLADEIQHVIDHGKLPSSLAESIDAIRRIGNFAAHPTKTQRSGEIMPVEPGEAEWNLDVLESLFDFYFVQPEAIRKKREALNQRLKVADKPPKK
jgi:hypothetical protein